jgi:hypothetical protein
LTATLTANVLLSQESEIALMSESDQRDQSTEDDVTAEAIGRDATIAWMTEQPHVPFDDLRGLQEARETLEGIVRSAVRQGGLDADDERVFAAAWEGAKNATSVAPAVPDEVRPLEQPRTATHAWRCQVPDFIAEKIRTADYSGVEEDIDYLQRAVSFVNSEGAGMEAQTLTRDAVTFVTAAMEGAAEDVYWIEMNLEFVRDTPGADDAEIARLEAEREQSRHAQQRFATTRATLVHRGPTIIAADALRTLRLGLKVLKQGAVGPRARARERGSCNNTRRRGSKRTPSRSPGGGDDPPGDEPPSRRRGHEPKTSAVAR